MNRIKQYISSFMFGRYGFDNLGHDLIITCAIIIFLNIFIRSYLLYVLYVILLALLFFRMLSKNISKRQSENSKYITFKASFKNSFKLKIKIFKERKTHAYRKCPNCKNTLRFPRQKGEHEAVCPCCKNKFKVKIK